MSRKIYDAFLTGKIDVGANRSDLGANLGNNKKGEYKANHVAE